MQISDASSIARLVPGHFTPQVKQSPPGTPQVQKSPPGTPQPQPNTTIAQAPTKTSLAFSPTPISSPIPQLPQGLPEAMQVEQAPTMGDPMKALMNDWGKSNSPYDLDGDGTVGIKDMLQLLKEMAESPAQQTDPLQALLDDWGKAGSPHDLDGDGTVGIKDMLQLLAGMATDPDAIPDDVYDPRDRPSDTGNGDEPTQANRLQALIDDWGKTGSTHDLDGDGTVGISDMLQLLKQMAEEAKQPAGDTGSVTPGETPAQTRLDQLIEKWGSADPEFDLNADGKVGIRDMLMMLARMANSEVETGKAANFDPKISDKFNPLKNYAANYHRVSAHNIARSLMPQIASMEPGELRESILQGSQIPSAQKQFVLDQIAAWHPHRVSELA